MGDARALPAPLPSLGRGGIRRAGGLLLSLLLALLIAMADRALGANYHLDLLYFAPIALASWTSGRIAGMATVVLAVAASWRVGHQHPFETAMAAVLFMLLVDLVARLRKALHRSDQRFAAALAALPA